MKFKMKRLAVTAILLSSTSMLFADGRSNISVGDLPGFGEDAYFEDGGNYVGDYVGDEAAFEDEAAYQEEGVHEDQTAYNEDQGASPVSVIEDAAVRQAHIEPSTSTESKYAPIGLTALHPTAYHEGGSVGSYVDSGYAPACGCDGGCDGGCDSAGCFGKRCGIGKLYDCNTWATYEALLWFPQSRKMPSLVTAAAAGVEPVLSPGGGPADGVTTLFGGDIDGGLSAGFRADYGKWVCDSFGIGGRFWWIDDNNDSYRAFGLRGADGSVGRPFYDTNGGENSYLVAFLDNDREFAGDISVETSLEMLAAELYGRFRLGASDCHQLDLIGGYSYFRIHDNFRAHSSVTTIDSPPLGSDPGTVRTLDDTLRAENQFHGGQLGFELSATRGCWMVRSLTKVHLGNMDQSYNGSGRSVENAPPPPGTPPEIFDHGMYVQNGLGEPTNRDLFTFAPEANFKLAYRFRPNVLLSVGYSFIYFDNVALTGAVIDRTIDGTSLLPGPSGNRPAFVFDDDSLWVHGIDLGAVIDF